MSMLQIRKLEKCDHNEDFFTANDDKFQHLIDVTSNLGYGVRDDLEEMHFNAQAEVYGEEDDV